MRKEFGQGIFDFLRAEAGIADFRVAAFLVGANRGNRFGVSADMAAEFLVLPMISEREAAIGTSRDVATKRALQGGGIAAPIQKQDGLLASIKALGDGLFELGRKYGNRASLPHRLAHIHNAHDRHFLVVGPFEHLEKSVFSPGAVIKTFQGRGRRAQDHGGLFHLASNDGDIAGMVARRLFLFVSVLVLLIHNDQTQRIDRRKNRRAGADDNAGASLPDFVPFIMAFAGREMAVQNGYQGLHPAGAEARLESFDSLRGEGNLGDQDDGALALLQSVGEGLEINFGLAAAGNTVEEEGARRGKLLIHGGRDGVKGFGLGIVEGERLGGKDMLEGIRIALRNLRGDCDQTFVFQAADGGGSRFSQGKQFLQRQLAVFFDNLPDFPLAFGQLRDFAV